ncbi:hypothetical protein, partial [Paraburkholderia sp. BR10954]|uniref:hypothetical protein n=1 Tax=Paraburkholderia sp. BR10954 TaxID=3236995 RepID=UPI0034D36747
ERNTGCVAALRFTRGWRKFRNNARPRLVRSAVPLSNGLSMGDCVFRTNVTDRFGIVTGDFGNVTGHFGNVTERTGKQDWRCA